MDVESASAVPPGGPITRLRRIFTGSGEASTTRRLAGTIFLIRVISAGLAYLSQILLARWMGGSDYGIYVYVWTWVLLLGSLMDFGISASAQKIIPEYRASGDDARLRGFVSGSRWMTFAASTLIALGLAGLVRLISPSIDPGSIVPLYLGCLTLPAFVVANTQDGIARSHDWMRLGLMPQFIVRQSLIVGFTAGAFALGFQLGASIAMMASVAAVWLAMLGQMIVLNRRLKAHLPAGPRTYDYRGWLKTSLPILLVESFYMLLSYTDVLVLRQFRPSEEVGVYFAVVKTLALVSFIHYAMSATTAHRFTEYHASGDKARLAAYVTHAIAWTFWPSLAATIILLAVGKPLLALFGPTLAWWCARRSARWSGCSTCSATRISAPWPMRAPSPSISCCACCWCRAMAATARRRRPRWRWPSRPCCCSGSCAAGSGCTCWRSGKSPLERAGTTWRLTLISLDDRPRFQESAGARPVLA
jgi:O-antigen/teichoic acid export membrane protein